MEKEIIETTARRLQVALESCGLTQAELVEKTGLPKSAVSQYVSGKFKPKQKALYLMAKALNINIVWLMGFDVSMEADSNNRIASRAVAFQDGKTITYDDLPEEGQREMDSYLEYLRQKYPKGE